MPVFTYLVWMIHLSLVDQIMGINTTRKKKFQVSIGSHIHCHRNFSAVCCPYWETRTVLHNLDIQTKMNYLLTHPWDTPDHQDLSKGRNKTGQLRTINTQNWAYQNGTRQKISEVTVLSQGWQSPKAWNLMLTQRRNTLNLAAVCYGGLHLPETEMQC